MSSRREFGGLAGWRLAGRRRLRYNAAMDEPREKFKLVNLLRSLVSIRFIGLGNAVRALRYAGRRDRLERRFPAEARPPRLAFPGPLRSVEATTAGMQARFENTTLEVRFLTPDLLFVAWDGAKMIPSPALAGTEWPAVKTELTQNGDQWRLASGTLTLDLGPDGTLELLDDAGHCLRRDAPPVWEPEGWRLTAELPKVRGISGLGGRMGGLDLRPGRYRLWNTDPGGSYGPGADPLYITMPVYFALRGDQSQLAFYDNSFDGLVTLDEENEVQIEFSDGPLRYYVTAGSPEQVLARWTQLSGRAPLPPRWALGYHQSQWGYGSEEEVRRIWQEFQARKLPLSGLWLDIDHMDGFRIFTVDKERFPTLPALGKELHAAGARLVAIVDPGVKRDPTFDLYRDGNNRGVFCTTPDGGELASVVWPGWSVFPDFGSPQARTWWGEQYPRLLEQGITGFWHDMNEPATFAAWGRPTLPLSTRHHLEGEPADHRPMHNLYALLMNRAGYEALRQLRPGTRPFILTRSGWVGLQRYAWSWTGDVETSWGALRATIGQVLGLGLCGVPYSGPDIGGFSGAPEPELFVRWFQAAAYLPFFRTHSAHYLPRREPWEFGPDIEMILRRHLEQRYRMLPLLYTLAWQAQETGTPIVRPLWWADPDDEELARVEDAWLLGDTLLAAPVVVPGAKKRQVRLPAGGWYDLTTDQFYPGGQTVELDAPLERMPLLARAGAILPLTAGDTLELHFYRPEPGQEGAGLLYSDAGDDYGPSRVDRWTLKATKTRYELDWLGEGQYPWPYMSVQLFLHGMAAEQVWQGEQPISREGDFFSITPMQRVSIPAG